MDFRLCFAEPRDARPSGMSLAQALRVQRHLSEVMALASGAMDDERFWAELEDATGGSQRFDVEDFTVRYELDRAERVLRVLGVSRRPGGLEKGRMLLRPKPLGS